MNDDAAVMKDLNAGGFLQQVKDGSGLWYDATADGQDLQTVMRQLLTSIPNRFLRNYTRDGRFYVPVRAEQLYRDALSARGTVLGDISLQGNDSLKYQAINIVAVPSMFVDGSDKSHVLLAQKTNLLVGFQRDIRIETWRDPREGSKSWVVTVRFDAKVAVPEACAAAENVDVAA